MKWEKMIGSPSGIGQIIGRRGWLTICADFSAAHDCFSDYLPPAMKDPPPERETICLESVVCCERLSGLLKHYEWAAWVRQTGFLNGLIVNLTAIFASANCDR
jgi:hypothetical protein